MRLLRMIAPAIPYLAVMIGLYALHSAWVAMVGYHLGMIGVLCLCRGWRFARMRISPALRGWLLVAALVGLSVGGGIYLCWPLLGSPDLLRAALSRIGIAPATWPLFILYFCAVNPWLEEFFWRGYLHDAARGVTLNDLLFAGYHLLVLIMFFAWPWLVLTLVLLTASAWTWRQVNRVSDSMLLSTICHLFADAGILLTVWALVR